MHPLCAQKLNLPNRPLFNDSRFKSSYPTCRVSINHFNKLEYSDVSWMCHGCFSEICSFGQSSRAILISTSLRIPFVLFLIPATMFHIFLARKKDASTDLGLSRRSKCKKGHRFKHLCLAKVHSGLIAF